VARIVRREDVARVEWERPLSFPGFRAEWLPGRAEDTSMQYRGVTYLAREEHRAVFAARPGRWTIPSATLRCTIAGHGPRPEVVSKIEVPAVEVRVDPIPGPGRPEGWNGLVGPVQVQAIAEPQSLTLGGSVRISVQVRGRGNLWILDPPLGESAIEGGEVFPRPAELALDEGQRLGVRRFFRYQIVPRRSGRLTIPALRFPYYDPARGRFGEAATAPLEIRVAPRPAVDSLPLTPTGGAERDRRRNGSAPTGDSTLRWIVGAATVVAGLSLLGVFGWRRGRVHSWKAVERALAAARSEADAGDPLAESRELARALRAALAHAAPRLADLAPAALRSAAARPPPGVDGPLLREIAEQLEALDWIRFSGELGHPDRRAAREAIEALRAATAGAGSA
jgi:hypothetical protein